jgi:superfamily II DNA/RNA helicase
MALRGGADIVVATPGRLLDLVDHNALRLADVMTLVLDEADRLLDLGFSDELARIIERLPWRRQNLLFSATFPPAVHVLAEELLHDPIRIDVPSTTATQPAILRRAIHVDPARRTQLLRHLIMEQGWTRVLVFCRHQVLDRTHRRETAPGRNPCGCLSRQTESGRQNQGACLRRSASRFQAGRGCVLALRSVGARCLGNPSPAEILAKESYSRQRLRGSVRNRGMPARRRCHY